MYVQTENQAAKRNARWLAVIIVAAGVLAFLTLASSVNATGNGNPNREEVREIGVAFPAQDGECNDLVPNRLRGNDLVPELTTKFTGGLEGCIYTYVDPSSTGCFARADGTFSYVEEGNEFFVGTYSDEGELSSQHGTIKTKYWFEATFPSMADCENFTNQIDGGCVHTFIRRSGTGVFRGARGVYNVIDRIVDGAAVDFPYIMELSVRRR